MAEGLLRSFDKSLDIYSGGTKPAERVNPFAVKVMHELGIDISHHTPSHVDDFVNESFDYVITVCDGANESCPVFTGIVKHRLHIGFPDPADATGSEEEILPVYREVRDAIKEKFYQFYQQIKS
jgi:arsenate reductase